MHESEKGFVCLRVVEGGGFAVPVGGELGAAGGTGAVSEALSEAVGGSGMAGEGCALQAGDAAGGVFGAADTFEVALTELVQGICAAEARGLVESLHGGLIVTLATAAAQQAFGLLQEGEGW